MYLNGVNRYSFIVNSDNYILDSLKEKITGLNISKSDSLFIWNTLCNQNFDRIKECRIVYKKRSDGYDYELRCASDMLILLKSEKWLYNSNGIKCNVTNFYIEDLNETGY